MAAILPVYSPFSVAFTRGEGVHLYDTAGKRYLDFGSGVAVNALGHGHPAIVAAITEQAGRLFHVSNWYQIPEQQRAAQLLTDNSFADYVFFTNSGTEAIECGIKLIRQHFAAQGQPQRHEIITFHNAFHGRTFGAMAATGKGGFEPVLQGFRKCAYNDIDALAAAITPATAAIMLEPVQGEGGAIPADLSYLRAVRALCDAHGILLFLDEIQTGIGRTGKLFAHEWAGITPDVLASAKGIGAGFPVGACMATQHAAAGMVAGMHGSTFGGNPLACRVVEVVLTIMLDPLFLPAVDAVARQLWFGLVDLVHRDGGQVFTRVCGAGLLLALECAPPNRLVAETLLKHGLLVIPAGGNTIRLLPPLVITTTDVDEALARLEAVRHEVCAHA